MLEREPISVDGIPRGVNDGVAVVECSLEGEGRGEAVLGPAGVVGAAVTAAVIVPHGQKLHMPEEKGETRRTST